MRQISAEKAFDNLKANSLSIWPSDRYESNRLEPRCEPGFKPSFYMSPGEKVFTIGSCFARNVEIALVARGFDVVTRNIAAAGAEFENFGPNILNNFGVPSIFNELDWALNENTFDETANFFEVAPGRFIDIHLPMSIRPAAYEVVRRRRAAIRAVHQRAAECSLVIITLGLTEVWFDTTTGRYLNYAPPKMLVAKYPSRFELRVLDYKTTMEFLNSAILLLKTRARSEQKIVITVSPVPLFSTFTDDDVIVANCYSKSLLRVVAQDIVAAHGHIDYYPSYESVTLSDRKLAWRSDLHHVESSLVETIVERMVSAYTSASDGASREVAEAFREATEYVEARNLPAAYNCLEPVADRLTDETMLLSFADVCARVGRHEKALSILNGLPAGAGGWRRALSEARCLLATGDQETALTKVSSVLATMPRSALAWQVLAEIRFAGELWTDAIVAAKKWAEFNIRSGEPFRLLAEIYRKQGDIAKAKRAYAAGIEREIRSPKLTLDYAEFLLDQGEFQDARRILEMVAPDSRASRERIETLSLFLN